MAFKAAGGAAAAEKAPSGVVAGSGKGLAALMAAKGTQEDQDGKGAGARMNWKLGAAASSSHKSLAHLVKAAQEEEKRQQETRAAKLLKGGVASVKDTAAKGFAPMKQVFKEMGELRRAGDYLGLAKYIVFGVAGYVRRKGKDMWSGLRSEHAIISFIYPHDEDTDVVSDPQVAQIFWCASVPSQTCSRVVGNWPGLEGHIQDQEQRPQGRHQTSPRGAPAPARNMLMMENVVLAMLYDNDDDGPLISIKVIILAFIAAGICAGTGIFTRLIFRWGNKGKRFTRRIKEKKAANKELEKRLTEEKGLSDAERMKLAMGRARSKKRTKRSWRQIRDTLRLSFAWFINVFFYLLICWFIWTYASVFGPEETKGWLMSWLLASGNAWIIIEPLEVVIIVMLPFLFDNACVANCRTTEKELGLI